LLGSGVWRFSSACSSVGLVLVAVNQRLCGAVGAVGRIWWDLWFWAIFLKESVGNGIIWWFRFCGSVWC
jgi:hypothetical protein